MKQTIYFFFLFFFLSIISCKKNTDTILIEGRIEDLKNETIYLADATKGKQGERFDTLLTTKADSLGHFYFEIETTKSVFYYLLKNKGEYINFYPIFLEPKDSILVEKDTTSNIIFSGKAAYLNNYFMREGEKMQPLQQELISWYSEPEEFIKGVEKYKKTRIDYFETYFKNHNISELFKGYVLKEIACESYREYFRYLNVHSYFAHDIPVTLTIDSLKFNLFDKIDYNETSFFKTSFAFQNIIEETINYYYDNKPKTDTTDMLSYKFEISKSKFNGFSKETAIYSLINNMGRALSANPESSYKVIQKVKEYYSKNNTNEIYYNAFIDKFNMFDKISIGKVAPNFELPDSSGKMVSLSSFKGKNIFIDFWGTWCGPCIEAMPKVMALKSKYKNKNIEFLFIALEYDKEDIKRWKAFIKDHKIEGINLVAEKQFHNQEIKPYLLNSAPSYMLIDSTGKIFRTRCYPEDIEKLLH